MISHLSEVSGDIGVSLIDFGIASILKSKLLAGGGTPGYIAPEIFQGEKMVSHKADVFSVGSILFSLHTGESLFQGITPSEVFFKNTQSLRNKKYNQLLSKLS